eukprot:9149-Heterococcus_DN1.PRE.3
MRAAAQVANVYHLPCCYLSHDTKVYTCSSVRASSSPKCHNEYRSLAQLNSNAVHSSTYVKPPTAYTSAAAAKCPTASQRLSQTIARCAEGGALEQTCNNNGVLICAAVIVQR